MPGHARLLEERQLGDFSDKLGVGEIAEQPRLAVETLHGRFAGKLVCQSRRMAQQILDRDRPFGWDQFEFPVLLDADLRVGEFRQVLRHGVGDEQPSVLDQHHERDRDDRLGHRIDAEDRVAGHYRAARPQHAEVAAIADLAAPRDHHRNSRQAAGVDFALHDRGQLGEAGRRQPSLFRGTDWRDL